MSEEKEFNLSEKYYYDKFRRIYRFDMKDIKEFIRRLKEETHICCGECEDSFRKGLDKFAGEKLVE